MNQRRRKQKRKHKSEKSRQPDKTPVQSETVRAEQADDAASRPDSAQAVVANRANVSPIESPEVPGEELTVSSLPPAPPTFSKVLSDELQLIARRRGGPENENKAVSTLMDEQSLTPGAVTSTDEDASQKQARLAALRGHVTGLSFSGGGIRSGTFAVGFIQGLASLGLLKRLDYLSTVSGGGYAGAWLAAWLKREGGDPTNVERQLSPGRVAQARAEREYLKTGEVVDEEPQPLRHLRSYSSYMFPRPGLLSVDTWTVILIWARNVSINLLMLLPLAMLLVVAGRLAVYAFVLFDPVEYEPGFVFGWPGGLTFLGLLVGLGAMVVALRENARDLILLRRPVDTTGNARSPATAAEIRNRVRWRIILPAGIAALLLTVFLRPIVWAFGVRIENVKSGQEAQIGKTFGSVIIDAFQSNLDLLGTTNFLIHFVLLGGLLALGATETACRSLKPGGQKFDGQLDKGPYRVALGMVCLAWFAIALILFLFLLIFFEGHFWPRMPALERVTPRIVLILIAIAGVATLVAVLQLGDRARKFIGAAGAAGATGGVLLVLLEALIRALAQANRPDLMATFTPPLTLLIAVAALIVQVAVLGRKINEAEREWWARISARLMLVALFWIVGMAVVLYLPALFLGSRPIIRSLIASGWLVSAAAGVLSGRFVLPKAEGNAAAPTHPDRLGGRAGLPGRNARGRRPGRFCLDEPSRGVRSPEPQTVLVRVLPGGGKRNPDRVADPGGLGVFVSVPGGREVDRRQPVLAQRDVRQSADPLLPRRIPANGVVEGAVGVSHSRPPAAGRGPSLTSTAAGRWPDRDGNPITGFDPEDDLDLARLRIGRNDDWDPAHYGPHFPAYYGPHLLINTTLNLIGSNDLATRDRKGESFLLSPLYCGSRLCGYSELTSPDPKKSVDPYLTLGRAISVSGAAVDPNMSFYQSAPLTALLTIFNARLGYWIEKPKKVDWTAASPRASTLLLQELFGWTDDLSDYVHISDGGHFENLGVYELIRRRCRYIILLDAEDDWDASDDNLANLIRLCRIDFGIRIRIDTSPLKATGDDRLSRSHVVVGQIHYDDVDRGELPGVLVYVKASMTGDESPDIQKYAKKDERFPHQPTDLQQIFDEEQFECYRSLGDHIARKVFEEAVYRLREDLGREQILDPVEGDPTKLGHNTYVPRLFSAIQDRWAEPPEDLAAHFGATERAWSAIRRDLGRLPELAELSHDLYPLLAKPQGSRAVSHADRERAELHTVSRILGVMESSWMALRLNTYSALPMNRGWMNTCRRLAGSRAFRRLWPVLRSEFSSDFVRFCELQLNLTAAAPEAVRVGVAMPTSSPITADFQEHWPAIQLLAQEFEREWPLDHAKKRGICDLIKRAVDLGLPELPVWVIYQAPSDKAMAGDSKAKFPCGIIIAANFEDFPAQDDPDLNPTGSGSKVELLVWVRRPHRSVGLGSRCLTRKLIENLRLEIKAARQTQGQPPGTPLWTRYPLPNPVDEDIEYRNWMVFFARYDFKPKFRKEKRKRWDCSLLELE